DDGNGHGEPAWPIADCDPSAVSNADDCDDSDEEIHPDAIEMCNGVDDDCSGSVDVGAIDAPTWYRDLDLDGFGSAETVVASEAPAPFVATGVDCDDADVDRNPDAEEICNEIDDDCDTLVDTLDDDLVDGTIWYDDGDHDGYEDEATGALLCEQPDGSVESAGDCDDGHATVNPEASEVCDGLDDDCDDLV